MSDDQTAKAPTLQVISGDATAEEIAAVIAVLAAAGAAAPRRPRAIPMDRPRGRRLEGLGAAARLSRSGTVRPGTPSAVRDSLAG